MTAPYYEERFNITGKEPINLPENSDVFADQVPVDQALVHETPMGGTVAAVGPMNEPVANAIPMFETSAYEIPMGGTVAAVGPMNSDLRTDSIPMYETPVKETLMSETVVSASSISDLRADSIPMYETPVKEVPVVGTVAAVELKDEAIPYNAHVVEMMNHQDPVPSVGGSLIPLLNQQESEHFRSRWNEIQGKFVDEPRTAVQQADTLVSEVVTQITQMFATEHSSLESQWKQGNDVSTEDLRKALQRYRSFFNRLVV